MLCFAASAQSFGAHQDSFDYYMRELRYAVAPDFNYNYGDWIQYIPGAATWVLIACGVQSRSSWGQMAVSQAGGALLSWGTVMAGKFGLARMRPDGSRTNSFPSGHTATAFLTATWLQKEYGADMPWLGALGYGVASLTAQQRILRNKHWAEDTMAGAVLGVATAELGYWLGALIFKQGHDYNWHQDFCYDPLTAGLCADFALTGACKVRALAEWEGMNIFPEELCRPHWMNSLNLGLGGVIFF